ncbi:hypothetical protein PL321_16430 [Caloramator sp. mosi_1]|nr:hypothetical protein [Caloramator sp. mosi_1]WDC83957.1 hypothetical protein PL321_16430 [Caloramator sp. mosi_1]
MLIKIIDKTYVMVTSNNYSKVLFDIEDFKEITENNVDFNLLRYIKDNLKLKRED